MSTTKDSTNGTKLIIAFRIWKDVLGVGQSSESDMDKSNPYGNQLHILSTKWKILMVQTPPINEKKHVPHFKHD